MTSKADYLKKYLSPAPGDQEKRKKKKNKENKDKPTGLRLIEEDAFLSVDAAKVRDIGSDEEREEIEVLKQSVKKAKVVHGFKQTFAEVNAPKEIKAEPLSPSNSPPRKPRQRHDSDHSPPRASRKRHDSDNSPPRPSRRRHDSDSSPPRSSRRRHDSDEDNSPRRRPAARERHDSDNSPHRLNRKRRDSDISPVRRRPSPRNRRDRHDSDNSPPRARSRRDSDNSPPRRRDRDSSPPRRRRRDDDDLSPPRKSRKIEEPKKIKKEEPDSDTETSGKTLEGKRAGLQSARDLKEESDKLRAKNAKIFEEMDSSVSGRFADTVYRQKQTKRKGKDSEEDQAKKEREAKKTEELKEKYQSWNKGVAQIESRREQLEEMARVAAEPLARARDDDAMNAHLKEVLHAADPMANIIQKKRRDTAIDRGELVYPTYQGHWVPNRFGIAPGYRWDGVDRSNGFEGKLAKTANTKTANQSEYYKSLAEYE